MTFTQSCYDFIFPPNSNSHICRIDTKSFKPTLSMTSFQRTSIYKPQRPVMVMVMIMTTTTMITKPTTATTTTILTTE